MVDTSSIFHVLISTTNTVRPPGFITCAINLARRPGPNYHDWYSMLNQCLCENDQASKKLLQTFLTSLVISDLWSPFILVYLKLQSRNSFHKKRVLSNPSKVQFRQTFHWKKNSAVEFIKRNGRWSEKRTTWNPATIITPCHYFQVIVLELLHGPVGARVKKYKTPFAMTTPSKLFSEVPKFPWMNVIPLITPKFVPKSVPVLQGNVARLLSLWKERSPPLGEGTTNTKSLLLGPRVLVPKGTCDQCCIGWDVVSRPDSMRPIPHGRSVNFAKKVMKLGTNSHHQLDPFWVRNYGCACHSAQRLPEKTWLGPRVGWAAPVVVSPKPNKATGCRWGDDFKVFSCAGFSSLIKCWDANNGHVCYWAEGAPISIRIAVWLQ